MGLTAQVHKQIFEFSFNARTSRGAMKDKTSWFIRLTDENGISGIGECGPLPGLSPELTPEFETGLEQLIEDLNQKQLPAPVEPDLKSVSEWIDSNLSNRQLSSSVRFALETALLDLANGGGKLIFKNSFTEGVPIPINGLIWMGGLDFMLQQIEIKIRDGFTCIKLKVGSHDFEKECDVLQYIRRKYFRENITIRLDANGAFKPEEALDKLNRLARYDIHSIEQPLKPGHEFLPELCRQSPIPIALDEELTGVEGKQNKIDLLNHIKPAFIILKPTLHGGLASCAEWIELAEKSNCGWWITSALESNIGLNAIAQFTANYPITLPQGLGTGMIYTNNVEGPLVVNKGKLFYGNSLNWENFEAKSSSSSG
ncbi:MAG: o-succinylbenzoate synthase [Cyclobacteriaceae bacterium]|nr:o-succinylbenzoate synthase [Cyclobacteriaceae bacterium]